MKKCYSCGSEVIAKKSEERLFHFRGESFVVSVANSYCEECGEVFGRESESSIIKKLGKAYVKKYGLLNSKQISDKRNQLGISVIELNEKMGFPPGTVKALESGFTITIEQNEKLKKYFEEKKSV